MHNNTMVVHIVVNRQQGRQDGIGSFKNHEGANIKLEYICRRIRPRERDWGPSAD